MQEIPNTDGLYFATRDGGVFSLKAGKMLSLLNGKDGYKRVSIKIGGKVAMPLVHRLVALCYIPNPQGKPCVNHIDGNKQNNRAENLEWVTFSENLIHAYSNGLNKKVRPVNCYSLDMALVKAYPSARAAEVDGFSNQNISHCCKRKRRKHGGFIWRFADERS